MSSKFPVTPECRHSINYTTDAYQPPIVSNDTFRDTLSALTYETVVAVLQGFAAMDNPVTFSGLHDRVDVRDPRTSNHHL